MFLAAQQRESSSSSSTLLEGVAAAPSLVPLSSAAYKHLPLQAKDVRPGVSVVTLRSLPVRDQRKADDLEKSLTWLFDHQRYADALPRRTADGCPQPKLSHEDVLLLERVGVVRQIPRHRVRGHVKLFDVPEIFKMRRRAIKFTEDINNTFGKDTLRKVALPTKDEICHLVNAGTHHAQFDFTAWFDQIKYDPRVGEYACFRSGGKFFCLSSLAMGQRQAVEIAQAISEYLVDFPERRCAKAFVWLDNVIFVGSYADVAHDSAVFLRRCDEVHALVNDRDKMNAEGEASFILTAGEWCGVHLDFTTKSVKLTAKTATKFDLSWGNRANWTWRQFAAHIGLLFWTWGILDVPVHRYYPLLRFISKAGKILQENDDLWDERAAIDPSALPAMEAWTMLAAANEPRRVRESAPPEWFVCTDASAWGWGYVAFCAATGEIRTHGHAWSRDQLSAIFARCGADKIRKSVYSEPLAVYCALCHLLKKGVPMTLEFPAELESELRTKIRVATDNSSACHTINRGFASRSFDLNEQIARLKDAFPESHFDIDLSFVPGSRNLADAFSRNKVSSASTELGASEVIRNFSRTFGDFGSQANFTGCSQLEAT